MKLSLIVLSAMAYMVGSLAGAKPPDKADPPLPPEISAAQKTKTTGAVDTRRVGLPNQSTLDRGPPTDPRVHAATPSTSAFSKPEVVKSAFDKTTTPKPSATPAPQKPQQMSPPQAKPIPHQAEGGRSERSGGSLDGRPTDVNKDHFDRMTHTG